MGTVNREIAEKIASNQGRYEDDSLVVKIVEYDNAWNAAAYGLVYWYDDPYKYAASDYVRNPRIFWSASCEQ